MKIDELIEKLQALKAEHGNLEVRVWENPVSTQPVVDAYYLEEAPWSDTEAVLIGTI